MRITRQTLLKIANDTVASRVRNHRNLLAAYLVGSMVGERDPVFGGTADIDLVFIHDIDPPVEREIVRLTEEVHLDIYHHIRSRYRQPRTLRERPQLGSAIYGCQILHDPRHFLDFAQASVRAQFFRPDNVLRRARGLLEQARETWFKFQFYDAQPGRGEVAIYLRAVSNVANAIACLSGFPLSERRFLLEFAARSKSLGKEGLYAGLLGLLGAVNANADILEAWLPAWENAYLAVGEGQLSLHPYRYPYYRSAMDALLESEAPLDVLWPLLFTWTTAVKALTEGHDAQEPWEKAFLDLGLLGDGFKERVAALDKFLDLAEETLDGWGREKGV